MLHCFGYLILLLWSSCLLLSVAGAAAVVLAATWLLLVLFIIITVIIDDRYIMLPFFHFIPLKNSYFFNTPIESPRVIWNKTKNNVTNLECFFDLCACSRCWHSYFSTIRSIQLSSSLCWPLTELLKALQIHPLFPQVLLDDHVT